MKIYLLTHERELKKPTNTGRIVKECLADNVEIVVWKRTEPANKIIELIDRDEIALLYPNNTGNPADNDNKYDNFLILDGTWQEARKMYNLSPYLQKASRVSLNIVEPSRYKLRRNQKPEGLSTAECAIELLRLKGLKILAEKIGAEFDLFNKR